MNYGVILADCPWKYGGSDQFQSGRAGRQYPTMRTRDLCALPVRGIAADNAVLLLWATWPLLPDAFRVIQAWGAEYVTGLPWIKVAGEPRPTLDGGWEAKPQYGIGFWVRSCSELLLICRWGDVTIRSPYLGLISENFGHSRKPSNVYEYAEQFPGPYAELFARQEQVGWAAYGNSIDGRDIREALDGEWR